MILLQANVILRVLPVHFDQVRDSTLSIRHSIQQYRKLFSFVCSHYSENIINELSNVVIMDSSLEVSPSE